MKTAEEFRNDAFLSVCHESIASNLSASDLMVKYLCDRLEKLAEENTHLKSMLPPELVASLHFGELIDAEEERKRRGS